MINLRDRIQQQVFRLNGLSMNEFDLSQPHGDLACLARTA